MHIFTYVTHGTVYTFMYVYYTHIQYVMNDKVLSSLLLHLAKIHYLLYLSFSPDLFIHNM